MNTAQNEPFGRISPQRSVVPVCGCGQDLDVVRGSHCPRCGTTLHHGPATADAA